MSTAADNHMDDSHEQVASPDAMPRARRRKTSLLVAGLWLYMFALLLSRTHTYIEVACHAVAHAAVAGSLLLLLCLWVGNLRGFLAGLVPWLYVLALWQPWTLWFEYPQASGPDRLKIVSWNVYCVNQRLDEIRSVIQSNPADVLILIELRPNLYEQVPEIEQMYPHHLSLPAWGGSGIAIRTRRADIQLERVDLTNGAYSYMPSIVATVRDEAKGKSVKIVAMHTISPLPPERATSRDLQLAGMRSWVDQQSSPVCVIGDLNITPWSPAFADLSRSGFLDSRTCGFGNSASWPAWLGPLGIPIDHALSKGDCQVVDRKLGPISFGSDHRPLLLELSY